MADTRTTSIARASHAPTAPTRWLTKSQSVPELDAAIDNLLRLLEQDPLHREAHYVLGQAYARRQDKELAQAHLALHRRILDTRVRIHGLERRAGRNPRDMESRQELVRLYRELGMNEHAEFWLRTIDTNQSRQP